MSTPCVHTIALSHTHSKGLDSCLSNLLILPSPPESPPALQSAKSLTFPLAFLPCHTQLVALEGSQGGRLPEQGEEQSWTEQRNGGQNSVLGTGSSNDSPCSDRPHHEPASMPEWPSLIQLSLILYSLHEPVPSLTGPLLLSDSFPNRLLCSPHSSSPTPRPLLPPSPSSSPS